MRAPDETQITGRLVENITYFTRALRKAGVRVGTAQVATAIRAVNAAGFTSKHDFYYTLRACLITRPEQLETFHQVFGLFWRDPEFLERMIRMMSPLLQALESAPPPPKPAERRAMDALTDPSENARAAPEREVLELDAQLSSSATEVFRKQDFEQMSAAELAEAARAIHSLDLGIAPIKTRRFAPTSSAGRPDIRAILRRSLRKGGEIERLARKAPRTRLPDLVVLCDISGSMSVYSRMMMHFIHTLMWSPNSRWRHISSFTFGTELTNISRALGAKDVDQALNSVGEDASDWQGGTRIGASLARFNKDWSRRTLGHAATVLLITDGLERGDLAQLDTEIERLSLSSKHLIWLNPLLRFDAFSPKAAGVRTILPYVTSFHACHSLDSLTDLSFILSKSHQKQRLMAEA